MSEPVSVCDGLRELGFYKIRKDRVEAWAADYASLGAFPSIETATAAIYEHALTERERRA